MNLSTFSFPTRIVFGAGALGELGVLAREVGGRRAFVVTDKGVVGTGTAERVRSLLKKARLSVEVFDDLETNPTEAAVLAAARAFKKARADLVVAVGGGSPLDTGKLVRLLATHKPPLGRYDDARGGGRHIRGDLAPMIAIPTTAGTGSEVGRSAVVTIATGRSGAGVPQGTRRKTVIFSPHLIPTAALCDPEVTVTMPARVTAATGMDALTHCIEAYLAKGYHPMADAIALDGVRLVARALPRAVESPGDLGARGDMMAAAMMGAVAFQKGLGVCHSLAHPLSSEYGVHHGLANAILLPAVLAFNAEAAPERMRDVARALGGAGGAASQVSELRRRIGLAGRLTEIDVPADAPRRLAPLALDDGCHQCNPRACTEVDLRALYEACL